MGRLRDLLRSDWLSYGGIHVHGNATVQSIANGASYVKVINFNDNDPSRNCTSDAVNDQITINSAGVYRIEGSFSFSAANNKTFFGALFLDGVEVESIHFTRKIGVAGDVGNASFTGLLSITAGQIIDFRMRHDDVAPVNVTLSYMNLNCSKFDRLD
jgi:hypothetical protein